MNRRYGPHRPEDQPTTVRVLRVRQGVRVETDEPIPAALLRQREQINRLAAER